MAKPTIRKTKTTPAPAAPVAPTPPAAPKPAAKPKHVGPAHQPTPIVTKHLKRYHLTQPFRLE